MKFLPVALSLVLVLLLVVNPNGVEARPAPTDGHQKKPSSNTLFVFGDDFADNGNLPLTVPVTKMSRQWPTPTAPATSTPMGFRGRILRPAASQTIRSNQISSQQCWVWRKPLRRMPAQQRKPATPRINAYIGKVTKEIAANVEQLQKIGVKKVLVNNLHPIGCTPSQTRTNNYTACDIFGNLGASIHNSNLKQVMEAEKNVHIIDLYTAFTNIVDHAPGKGSELSKQFKRKMSPCCESLNSKGYCGEQGESSGLLYNVCDKSNNFFYWDDMHPTHAGWEAVMKQLERPLREFIDQD
uniref:GDSL esterase/lipase n=1 Tax=Aegilops tauschii subsp. strangulata TaxID=200361 RepID=A0A453SIS9_AEGTS